MHVLLLSVLKPLMYVLRLSLESPSMSNKKLGIWFVPGLYQYLRVFLKDSYSVDCFFFFCLNIVLIVVIRSVSGYPWCRRRIWESIQIFVKVSSEDKQMLLLGNLSNIRRFLEFLLIPYLSKNLKSLTSAKPPMPICLVIRTLIPWMSSLTLVSRLWSSFLNNWAPIFEPTFWYYDFVLKRIFCLCSWWLWFRGWGNSLGYDSKLQVFIGEKRWDEIPSLSATGNKFFPKVERKASLYATLSSVNLYTSIYIYVWLNLVSKCCRLGNLCQERMVSNSICHLYTPLLYKLLSA